MAGFHNHLILNRWLFGLFHQKNLHGLKQYLNGEQREGLAEDGHTRFLHALTDVLFFEHNTPLTLADLHRYDLNIVQHWQQITKKRNQTEAHELKMKYFQYLALLFSEIYLDWYFNRPTELQKALNRQLQNYMRETYAKTLQDYCPQDLNKIAFWNATGSGKTLLMHVNILQYLHYFGGSTNGKPDKILVLTPNEGLSRQHVEELKQSDFSAALFNKNRSGFQFKEAVEVIDINKLADKNGDKTVAVSSFDGNNLILVDEGHRGASGTEWMQRREALIGKGFAFEYSATLGQAVGKSKTVAQQEAELLKQKSKLYGSQPAACLSHSERQKARQTAVFEVYAKAVLFDYSYKFFYADGYGKESLILNMDNEAYQTHGRLYFTACLLGFYQQLYLFEKNGGCLKEWNLSKPLMVFVGNKVNKKGSDDVSDILTIVRFLAFFLNNPRQIQLWLADLLANTARILDKQGRDIFKQHFIPLMDWHGKEDRLYADILQRLFHAPDCGQLRLSRLKKADGELALSIGTNGKPFGIINIGDADSFFKTASQESELDCHTDNFSESLFDGINHNGSGINILIGSRKFTEGWSSWRVSTMGLLNMGKGEGSQIIQLFGRGVRLKGRNFSLKRSLPEERPKKLHLDKLETLNIFGVCANYMDQFKQYLKEEDITPPDDMLQIDFKTQPNLPNAKLKTLRLKDGYKDNQKHGFKRSQNVWLYEIPQKWQGKIKAPHAVLDCYPRVAALSSGNSKTGNGGQRQSHKLNSLLFDCFDWDRIYLALLDYKLKRTWSNLRLQKCRLREFAEQNDWYTLYIPQSELAVNSFADIVKQQNLLTDLLIAYTESFYNRLKAAYEAQFYETAILDEHNHAMQNHYRFTIEASDNGREYKQRLQTLKNIIEKGCLKSVLQDLKNWYAADMEAVCFPQHLYYPLITLHDNGLPFKMQPLLLNEKSEIKFVQDLQQAYRSGFLKQYTDNKEIYLLRNGSSQSKGLGFALAGSFYPDFLLWLVDTDSDKQWLTFIDPKGIRQMDLNHPKFGLYEEVQKLAAEINTEKQKLVLNSFILSVSAKASLINSAMLSDKDWADKHILFMENERYLQQMFNKILEI